MDCYSKFGPAPRQPSCMLRSYLLSIKLRITSITQWCSKLKECPLYAMLVVESVDANSENLLNTAALHRYFSLARKRTVLYTNSIAYTATISKHNYHLNRQVRSAVNHSALPPFPLPASFSTPPLSFSTDLRNIIFSQINLSAGKVPLQSHIVS